MVGKDMVVTSDGEGNSHSTFLVYTEDTRTGETLVFENSASLVNLKFNPRQTQASLKEGGVYDVDTVGWSVPALDINENITAIRKVSEPPSESSGR